MSDRERVLDTLSAALDGLTTALDSMRRELTEDKLELRGVATRLEALEKSVNKLREVVIEGNGSESLKATVGTHTRQISEVRATTSRIEQASKDRDAEDKRIRVAYISAFVAAATTIASAVVTVLYGGR